MSHDTNPLVNEIAEALLHVSLKPDAAVMAARAVFALCSELARQEVAVAKMRSVNPDVAIERAETAEARVRELEAQYEAARTVVECVKADSKCRIADLESELAVALRVGEEQREMVECRTCGGTGEVVADCPGSPEYQVYCSTHHTKPCPDCRPSATQEAT